MILLTLVVLGVLYQQVGARRDAARLPPPGILIDAGGHRLHAFTCGEGSPVVVLEAAIAGSSLSWAVVQARIASFTRVCAYDRAGLGWSEAPSSPRTLDRILHDVSAVLSHLDGRQPFVLVGHSFGSFIVRAHAARHPEHVAGIVLVDPPTEWLTMTPQRVRLLRGGGQLSRIGALLAHIGVVRLCLALLKGGAPGVPRNFVRIFGSQTAGTLERLVGEVVKLPPGVHPLVQAIWCQPKCFRAMGDYFQTLAREWASLATEVPPPAVPVVVISSGRQPPEQIAAHKRLVASSAHGRHVLAARSAHWVQFDEPELIVTAVRELVEAARSGVGAAPLDRD